MKRALICGVSDQDGAYLAELLLTKGYEVFGTSRDAQLASFSNLVDLGVRDRVQTESMAGNDFRSVLQVLMKVRPDEIYNLAGAELRRSVVWTTGRNTREHQCRNAQSARRDEDFGLAREIL